MSPTVMVCPASVIVVVLVTVIVRVQPSVVSSARSLPLTAVTVIWPRPPLPRPKSEPPDPPNPPSWAFVTAAPASKAVVASATDARRSARRRVVRPAPANLTAA